MRLSPVALAALVLLPSLAHAADPLIASGTQLGPGWTVQRVTLAGGSFQVNLTGTQGYHFGYGMVVHDLRGNGFISLFGDIAFYEWQNTARAGSPAVDVVVDASSYGKGSSKIMIRVTGCCYGQTVDLLLIEAGDVRSWGYNLTASGGTALARTSGPEAWAARARDFRPVAELDVSHNELGVVAAVAGEYLIDAPRPLVGEFWAGHEVSTLSHVRGPQGLTLCSCTFRDADARDAWPAGAYTFHLEQATLKSREARLVAAAPVFPS